MRGRHGEEAVASGFGHCALARQNQWLVRSRKGIRSMITSEQVAPGTSTPCQSDRVPEQARRLVLNEPSGEFGQLGVALAENRELRQLFADMGRGGFGGPT